MRPRRRFQMRPRLWRLAVVLGLSCLMGALLTAGLAGAGKGAGNRVHSNAKLSPEQITPDKVTGKVTAGSKACEKGRKAKLFVVPSGSPPGTDAELVGEDRSNRKGKFVFEGSFFVGSYRLKVAKKSLGGNNKTLKGKLEEELDEVDDEEEDDLDRRGGSFCSDTTTTTSE